MAQQSVVQLLKDPIAQDLLNSKIPARFAYTGLDGSPRVIPIWFHWDGQRFILGTGDNSPKVKAISKHSKVALTVDENTYPPKVLLVRGTARVQMIDGVVPEYAEAARKYLGEEQGRGWAEQARAMYRQMARIVVLPEWVKILDFQTRFPKTLEEAISRMK